MRHVEMLRFSKLMRGGPGTSVTECESLGWLMPVLLGRALGNVNMVSGDSKTHIIVEPGRTSSLTNDSFSWNSLGVC